MSDPVYDPKKIDFDYKRTNSLKARSTDDTESYLYTIYNVRQREVDYLVKQGMENEVLKQTPEYQALQDIKYAIACVDAIEELATMYYDSDSRGFDFQQYRKRNTEVRRNVVHAKRGGRFRWFKTAPPTNYKKW